MEMQLIPKGFNIAQMLESPPSSAIPVSLITDLLHPSPHENESPQQNAELTATPLEEEDIQDQLELECTPEGCDVGQLLEENVVFKEPPQMTIEGIDVTMMRAAYTRYIKFSRLGQFF